MPCSVTQAVVHRMTATVNPYTIGVGNHGGRDILIVNEAGLHRCTGGVASCKAVNCKDAETCSKMEQVQIEGEVRF